MGRLYESLPEFFTVIVTSFDLEIWPKLSLTVKLNVNGVDFCGNICAMNVGVAVPAF
jgi:hypothetical protein